MNVQRRVNLRKQQLECQFGLAQWMEESAGGATNANQKADGPLLITLQNTIQISLSTKKLKTKGVKSHGQIDIGEGWAPQHNFWLAEVKLPPHREKIQQC